MCLVQMNSSKRKEHQGSQNKLSFGKWQCNATQGQSTATACYTFSNFDVALLSPLRLLKS